MTHINLDTQPEVIRQFVLSLSASGEGVVLESEGRAVACVIPSPGPVGQAPLPESEWTEAMNQRRGALLDRKYDHGLDPAEEAELTILQATLYRHIDRVAPLPLDAARDLHQELLRKAAQIADGRQE